MELNFSSLGELVYIGHYRPIHSTRIHNYCNSQWYLLVLGELVKNKVLTNAECWLICDQDLVFSQYGVTVRCFRDFTQMRKYRQHIDLLWVRGIHRNYLPILNHMRCRLRMFYAASKRLVPIDWPYYDLIFVDDERHILPASRIIPGATVKKVIKTTDPCIFKPLTNISKQFDLIMIGDMRTERKNFAALVEILHDDPSLKTVIVGAPEKEFVDQLNRIGTKITYIDYCTRDELNLLFNQTRITFLPYLLDAAPRVILESMAAGTPIVAHTGLFGGRDYIQSLVGILANPNKMLQAIHAILQGDHIVNPKKIFDQQFTPCMAAQKLAEILSEAIMAQGGAKPKDPPNRLKRLTNLHFFTEKKLKQYWGNPDL